VTLFSGELSQELGSIRSFLEYHEERIVAAEGSQHILDLELIDAIRDTGGVSQLRFNHDKIAGELDIDDLAAEIIADEWILGGLLRGIHGVHVFPAAVRHAGDAEKLQIAREGRLCDLDPLFFQPLEKLFLAMNLFRMQNAVDQTPSRFLAFQIRPPQETARLSPCMFM
jgi:hypothetical protein